MKKFKARAVRQLVILAGLGLVIAQASAQPSPTLRSPDETARLLAELRPVPITQTVLDECSRLEAAAKQQAAAPSPTAQNAIEKGATALGQKFSSAKSMFEKFLPGSTDASKVTAPALPSSYVDGSTMDNCVIDAKIKAKSNTEKYGAVVAAPSASASVALAPAASAGNPQPSSATAAATAAVAAGDDDRKVKLEAGVASREKWPQPLMTADQAKQKYAAEDRDLVLTPTEDPLVLQAKRGDRLFYIALPIGLLAFTRDENNSDCYRTAQIIFLRIGNLVEPTASCPRPLDTKRLMEKMSGVAAPTATDGAAKSVAGRSDSTGSVAPSRSTATPALPPIGTYKLTDAPKEFHAAGWTDEDIRAFSAARGRLGGMAQAIPAQMKANEASLWAYVRSQPHFPEIMGRLVVTFASGVSAGRAAEDTAKASRELRWLAVLRVKLPEVDRVQFQYTTYEGQSPVNRVAYLHQLLLDGAVDPSSKQVLLGKLSVDDVDAMEAMTQHFLASS